MRTVRKTPHVKAIAVVTLAAAAAGCNNGSSNDNPGTRPLLAAFNAVADMRTITFLREEEQWATLDFGDTTGFRGVDADQYDLNFDAILPGDKTSICDGRDGDEIKDDDECTRLISQSINVVHDHEYVVALLGRYGDLRVQVYDKLVHEFDTTTTDGDPDDETTEVQFFHWVDDLPEIDVYLARPGANLSPVDARGSLSSGEELHAVVDDGDYVITLAPVGDPANPLFTSEQFSLLEQTRVGFAILPGAGEGTSTIKMVRFRDQAGTLYDRRVPTQMRVAHVAAGAGTVDIYAEEDYSQPFFANVAEETVTPYITVPPSAVTDLDLEITPVGNPGVLLAREQVDLARGERATFMVFDVAGRLDGLRIPDPFRRVSTHARLRVINAAADSLDFFVVRAGSNINTLTPTASLGTMHTTAFFYFDPERYDIVLTRAGTDDIVFGPETVDLAGGGIYTVVGTGDATSADALLLDDFAN